MAPCTVLRVHRTAEGSQWIGNECETLEAWDELHMKYASKSRIAHRGRMKQRKKDETMHKETTPLTSVKTHPCVASCNRYCVWAVGFIHKSQERNAIHYYLGINTKRTIYKWFVRVLTHSMHVAFRVLYSLAGIGSVRRPHLFACNVDSGLVRCPAQPAMCTLTLGVSPRLFGRPLTVSISTHGILSYGWRNKLGHTL